MNHPIPHASFPSSVTIERIETTIFCLPMHGALQWGKHSALNEANHVLVEVVLSDGSRGVAEAPPRPTIYGETVYSITSIIEHELAPRLIGQPLTAVFARLHEIKNNQTAKGAIDMALYDAIAVHLGISLPTLLAQTLGYPTTALADRVRVSYILGIGERETVLAEADQVYQQGVRVLKVKVGRNWRQDLELVDALQTHFSRYTNNPTSVTDDNTMWLYADANEGLSAEEAPNILVALRERGLRYCEEPLPVEQIKQRASLRAQEILPLIGDDSCFGHRDLERELALNTFDILNIKTARTGYTESGMMLQRAFAAGKGVMVGSQASTGLGTMRAAFFAALPGIEHPSELSFFLKVKEDILSDQLHLENGYLNLANLHGITVDRDRLRTVTQSAM